MTPNQEPRFTLLKVFTQDLSVEVPVKSMLEATPSKKELEVNISSNYRKLFEKEDAEVYECSLKVTAKLKSANGDVAMLIEVTQTAFASVKVLDESQRDSFLKVYMPTLIYPYARGVVSDLAVRSAGVPINLGHFDFAEKYMKEVAKTTPANLNS